MSDTPIMSNTPTMSDTPNLLFLFTDEQRADTLAAYGNSRIAMPNLNALAEESILFERAYCTQPICTPSRSSIMTGVYPHSNGCTRNNAPLPEEFRCLPEYPAFEGYTSAYHGKWHLGDEIFRQHGFNEWRSFEDEYIRHYRPHRDRSARSD
jgi:arylsulfatase A-like enzyme